MGKSALKQTAKKGGAKKVSLVVGGKVEKTGAAKAAVKTVKKVKKVAGKKTTDKKTGVLYIGHIPHGYYEKQMRNFLAQYGKILRLRISRNKKTGKSKGYGFVQYEDKEVAEAVAEELKGTFITGKVLDVAQVDPAKVHKSLWRGMKMRTLQKLDEDIRINGKVRTYAQLSEAPWQKKLMNFVTTERKVNAKLAKAGIDYEFRGFENQLAPLGLEYVPHSSARDSSVKGVVAGEVKKATKPAQKSGKLEQLSAAKKAAAATPAAAKVAKKRKVSKK